MNWEAIGAVGELVGALAVVLTLGYLAAQVRQNTMGARVAAKQEMTRQFSDYTDLLLQDPVLLSVYLRGLRGEELEKLESIQFNIMMQKATWYFASMHFQHSAQSLSDEEWHQSRILIEGYCGNIGYKTWWENHKKSFAPRFVDFIEEHWRSGDS